MKVGYSFWGFLGDGVADSSDSVRHHRRDLVYGLVEAGHEIVFLQTDRDLTDAGERLDGPYRWDVGLPELDILLLEWRWPIAGRNTTWCGAAGHECDLHRQRDLVDHYTWKHGLRTIIWDTNRRLDAYDPLRALPTVTVCEWVFPPTPGTVIGKTRTS
jgi:hypothetical protein